MSASMDNFWLVVAVRYGLPALVFLVLAILLIVFRATAQRGVTPEWANCRLAWISTMAAIALAACTVHLWNNTFGFFMFMLGAGAWLADRPRPQPIEDDAYDDHTDFEGEFYDDPRHA
jgi:hypothetical protein